MWAKKLAALKHAYRTEGKTAAKPHDYTQTCAYEHTEPMHTYTNTCTHVDMLTHTFTLTLAQ